MAASLMFSLPTKLDPTLARVFAYWKNLKRADNDMPFWDDVTLPALSEQSDRILLIDVFALPERFRFNTVGKGLAEQGGQSLNSKFLDELKLAAPFAYLRAQCSATVERRAPTCLADEGYSRIVLPMWGDGHISMLLGAVAGP